MKPKYYPYIIIAALVLLLILQRECRRCPDSQPPTVVTHIDTLVRVDTITHTHQSEPQIIHDTLVQPADFDTAAVIADYYTRRTYSDTIRDSVYQLIITDQVYMNRIKKPRKTQSIVFVPEITIYRTDSLYMPCPPTKALIYAGIGVGGWDDKFSIAPGLALVTKKRNMYMINYDPFNRVAQVHNYWRIRLKR